MALYLIGDIQGCDDALQRLLARLDFSPSRDTLFALGDLVNRGPQSMAVLRRLMALGDAAQCLLGNHDLHLLAMAGGIRAPGKADTVQDVLAAADRDAAVDWLRTRPLALFEHGILMVHAGVLPQWTADRTVALAGELHSVLRSADWRDFLRRMYGNQPARWSDDLQGAERLRVVVNALTRLRYCSADGEMEFDNTGAPEQAPPGYLPWFDVPGRLSADVPIAFGHWSSLGWRERSDVLPLDTGCVWGGCLSALRVGPRPGERELIQVKCEKA